MPNLANIKRQTSDCGKPIIKIVASSGCADEVNGNYYGTGDIITGSSGATAFPYQLVTNLIGFVRDIPREITRQNSKTCKPQKVQSAVKYEIQGAELYPPWKMRELEDVFMSENIQIDSEDVLYSGGTLFENAGSTCNNLFRLKVIVEECNIINIFGCKENCDPSSNVFLIPPVLNPSGQNNFYGDNGLIIANSYNNLLAYYRSQPNVISVSDVNIALPIQCSYSKVFSVKSKGLIPNVFYYNSPSQSNKVYSILLNDSNPDYNKLCRGVSNISCQAVIIEPPFVYELSCGNITIGEITTYSIVSTCQIMPFGNWSQYTGETSISGDGNTRTINLSLVSDDYVSSVSYTPVTYSHTIAADEQCELNVPIPPPSIITDVTVNGVEYTTWDFNRETRQFIFDPCLEIGDNVLITYLGIVSPTVQDEIIAKITGSSCVPKTVIYLNHSNNSSIKQGSTLAIYPNGDVRWTGELTSSDTIQSIITVTDIIYSII